MCLRLLIRMTRINSEIRLTLCAKSHFALELAEMLSKECWLSQIYQLTLRILVQVIIQSTLMLLEHRAAKLLSMLETFPWRSLKRKRPKNFQAQAIMMTLLLWVTREYTTHPWSRDLKQQKSIQEDDLWQVFKVHLVQAPMKQSVVLKTSTTVARISILCLLNLSALLRSRDHHWWVVSRHQAQELTDPHQTSVTLKTWVDIAQILKPAKWECTTLFKAILIPVAWTKLKTALWIELSKRIWVMAV